MDDKPEISNEIVKKTPIGQAIASLNPDAPEVASQIVKHIPTTKPTLQMNIPFEPYDHTTAEVPIDEATAAFGGNYGGQPKKEIGYLEGSIANFEHNEIAWQAAHGGWQRTRDYLEGYKDPNFNPMDFQDKFLNIRPEYQPYLLSAENEKQMDYRISRIQHEQWMDDTVKDGSWMQWLTGGGLGLGADLLLMRFVPAIASAKYASFGKTAFMAMAKNAPGAAAFGFGSAGAEQIDRINGNMKDFLVDSLVRSVFATGLFAAGPVAGLIGEKSELWNLQSYVADHIKGIGYKLKVGEKGEIQGFHAYDMTPNKGLSADVVKLAQDKADSGFAKNGLFKIPYLGTAAEKFLSNSAFGSNTLSMLTSPFKTVNAVINLAYDHGIITKGMAEGQAKVKPFYTMLQQTIAHIKQEQNIFNALHAERNGLKPQNYVADSLKKVGIYTRQKTLEKIGADIGDRPYISVDQFSEEVQQVLRSGEQHSEGSVNKAAAMYRESMDKYYSLWREAYNLPKDWMPPKTADAYLMRVYDTNFLNNNLSSWTKVIANELREQDNTIVRFTQPLNEADERLQNAIAGKERLNQTANVADHIHKQAAEEIMALRAQKKALEENLQNEIRTNPELHLLADDWNALSADEAKELQALTKRRDIAQKEVDEKKTLIAGIRAEAQKRRSASIKGKTAKTSKANTRKSEIGKQVLAQEEAKLAQVENELEEEKAKLQELAHSGKINRRFYKKAPDSNVYVIRDSNERLKLRKTYHEQPGYRASEEDAHGFREEHAKAYYDTIMNQTAEDTINQIMGRFTGSGSENHVKARTLMIPDEVLYKNKFMTKNLPSKVANYKMWLSRRTALQETYKGLSIDGGFEPVLKNLHEEFDIVHTRLNNKVESIREKLKDEKLKPEEKKTLEKGLSQVEDEIKKNTKAFSKGKEQVTFVHEKMMGISRISQRGRNIAAGVKAFTAFANLGFLPATMITDLTANGLKQGLIPFIVDGIYPAVTSLGGLRKTHDSESFRKGLGALNLGLHHIGYASARREMDLATNPYLNLGKIPAALDKAAHFTSNINLTTTIDNFLQQLTSSVAQSNVIRNLIAHSEGKLAKGDRMWLNRYGIDPEKDGEAILKAFRKDGGGSTKLGGYQSNFWNWEDMKSGNKVSDAVFRSTHDTIISATAFDSPIWLDENGVMGMFGPIIRGFKGWAFASLNRYLIPSMQEPDARKLMGFALMSASAALVGPSRRMARGQDPYTDSKGRKMTKGQIAAEILFDSPQFAWLSQGLNDANLFTGGTLLNDLKNDKYYDRTRIGLLGPAANDANKFLNFVSSMATGNMNEQDTMGMASMIPVLNSLYGYNASQHIVQGWGLPKHRPRP